MDVATADRWHVRFEYNTPTLLMMVTKHIVQPSAGL